ncbi:MAG: molybdopterin molybdenumtransferase MoeA [Nitratiruptor sp.]|nr:molybdopterin molybdenumtransferase MoeA [Nitratiruptor sp.]NPA83019.1 molybdopterin molybdotransferase MoeA [Campylobacterota bacterium]
MALSLMDALKKIQELPVEPRSQMECLESALGMVAAQDYRARYDLPPFANAAMDGFAIGAGKGGRWRVVGRILAGEEPQSPLGPGEAVRIMTGARIPEGSQAVVPIEEVQEEGEWILVPESIKAGAHIRQAGEDVARDSILVEGGEELTPFKLALLASQGYSYLHVYKRPRVTIFATGSELAMHYEPLAPNQIYNSNTPSLLTRARELGCEVAFVQSSADSLEAIQEAIAQSLESDLIVTSGGVSVGDADYTKEAFKAMGMELFFEKLQIKPGKPTTLGRIGSTYILNLPGNPLAAQLNFELIGRLLINRLRGLKAFYLRPIQTQLARPITNKPGRATIIPGYFDGHHFHPDTKRAPGMVGTMARSNGFIILAPEVERLEGVVRFIPLWPFYASKPEPILSS